MNLLRKKCTIRYFLPICLILALGCSEDEKPNCPIEKTNGDPKSVLGTWQLVKIKVFDFESGKEILTDYSCRNILFKFLDQGQYIVEGGNYDISFFSSQTSFEFLFEENMGRYGNSIIKIGDLQIPCFLEESTMTWNESWVDGDVFEFYRIN